MTQHFGANRYGWFRIHQYSTHIIYILFIQNDIQIGILSKKHAAQFLKRFISQIVDIKIAIVNYE